MDIQSLVIVFVLLIQNFKNEYLELTIPLHLIKSDCCEIIFFPRSREWKDGMCISNFKLVNYANIVNNLVAIEYDDNVLQFGQIDNKMENVWVDLHLLQEGEFIVNLTYCNLVM